MDSELADDFNVSIWFPVYPGDFLTDTAHLSNEETGIYMKLLCSYWRNDSSLKNNDTHLSKIAGITPRKWKATRPNLESLFIIKNDAWHNKALSDERYKATLNRMHKRRAAYVKHGNAEKTVQIQNQIDDFITSKSMHLHNNCTANAPKKSMHLQCPLPSPVPSPSPLPISTPIPSSGAVNKEIDLTRATKLKQPIPDDFYPTQETTEYAKARRLPDPTQQVLIDNFINTNQSNNWQSANWQSEFRKYLQRTKQKSFLGSHNAKKSTAQLHADENASAFE